MCLTFGFFRYGLVLTKIYPSFPILHQSRFMADSSLAPVCLRYILWALAASSSDKYKGLQTEFYQKARRCAEMDELAGCGKSHTTLAHCQTWIFMAVYEFKQMHFSRACLSTGRAVRIAQMLRLHRLDRNDDTKQLGCLSRPPRDWTETEEHRRTFWMTFCIDRYTSIVAGWPMMINEHDVSRSMDV